MSLYASCSCCWWLRRALKFLPWCYLLNHNLQRSDERCSLNFALIELEMFVGRSTLEYWTMERVYQKRTTKQPFTCHEQRARIWTFAVLMKFSPQTKKTWTFALFFLLCSQVVAFSICWAPIQIILVLKSLKLYETTTLTVSIQIISHVLAYLNSCLNPFLYAFLSENFRKAFRKVMWCGPASSHYILANQDTKSTRTGTRHNGNGAASVDIL